MESLMALLFYSLRHAIDTVQRDGAGMLLPVHHNERERLCSVQFQKLVVLPRLEGDLCSEELIGVSHILQLTPDREYLRCAWNMHVEVRDTETCQPRFNRLDVDMRSEQRADHFTKKSFLFSHVLQSFAE